MLQRLNDATGTGALSGGAQPMARISYAATWFDGIDRPIAAANYGATSGFTRPTTPPVSSASVLVNQTSYDAAGRVLSVTDPTGNVIQTTYDHAGRATETVEAYGTASARTTQFTYTSDSLTATMTAVNPSTGNQTTTWTYGTSSTSGVYRNDLLASVKYPDSAGGSDVVSYTYNRLGQPLTITDQRGTVRTFYYDKLGRQTDDAVSTVGGNTDSAVLRISRAYEARGLIASITSYDSATPGGGNALNQCVMSYNGFGQLTQEQQEHSGAVSGSSPAVQYGYDSGFSGSNEVRPSTLTYPNGRVVSYNYAAGADAAINRVTSISDPSATLASYTYLGVGTVARISYPQPSVWLDLWGGVSGQFNGWDLFDRVIDQRWQNNVTGTPADIDRYQYGYDLNSNRTWKANVIGTPQVTGGLDEFYAYDPLNRLTAMQRGTLNSTKTSATGTPVREMDWTLDPTGNWSDYLTTTNGTTDLSQTRTSNPANEITALSESTGPAWVTPAYDPAGNTTTMPQVVDPTLSYTAIYDAWNRVVSISASGTIVTQYKYDGTGRCVTVLTYASGQLSESRHFYYTDRWQDIEERVGVSNSMERQYVPGTRYLDEIVCRDRQNERFYVCQDANFNITAIADSRGFPVERYAFDPYGYRIILNSTWSAIDGSAYDWRIGHQALPHDTSTLLLHARYRHLHPLMGRLASRDPRNYHDSVNQYEYELSDPISGSDPFGLTKGGKQNIRPSDVPANATVADVEKLIEEAEKAGASAEHIAALKGYLKVLKRLKKFKGVAHAKLLGHIAVAGCEAACAAKYAECVDKEDQKLDDFLDSLRHGRLSPNEIDTAVDAALDAHRYGALACGTEYVACGLGCLCPFSFW